MSYDLTEEAVLTEPRRGPEVGRQSYHRRRRIAVLGAAAVGKSSITKRFVYNTFSNEYLPTIEDEHHQVLHVDGKAYYLEILDTSGQDEYTDFGMHYTIGLHGYILLFSVNDRASFETIRKVNDKLLVTLSAETGEVARILVGNKSDEVESRQVGEQEAKQFCQSQGIVYTECSALTGANVTRVFEEAIRAVEGYEPEIPKEEKGASCTVQ